jgi:3-oxoacyl-[acyl-carrier-protein] synthase-1
MPKLSRRTTQCTLLMPGVFAGNTSPHFDGSRPIYIALDEIKYINAHATSTPIGDLNEAKAIAEVFEGHRPYVTSTKSMTGHEMWMAGASEVIYSTLMMQNNFIAPNLNFEEPDEASAQLNIPAQRVNMEFDTFLSNSFGFGGTNSTLIIKKVK